jgi:hypothetical protein
MKLKTFKSYPFSGKKEELQLWHIKLKAYLTYHKYIYIITDKSCEAPKKDKVLDPVTGKQEMAKHDQNSRAFMLLTLIMCDAVSFEAVDSSNTDELPDGVAKIVNQHIPTKLTI